MLWQKQEAIGKEEEDFNRRCLLELKKKFVRDKLEAKEHQLFEKMSSETTSVPQMFNEYLQFKYDIYRWRLETQVKTHLFSPTVPKDEEVDVG